MRTDDATHGSGRHHTGFIGRHYRSGPCGRAGSPAIGAQQFVTGFDEGHDHLGDGIGRHH